MKYIIHSTIFCLTFFAGMLLAQAPGASQEGLSDARGLEINTDYEKLITQIRQIVPGKTSQQDLFVQMGEPLVEIDKGSSLSSFNDLIICQDPVAWGALSKMAAKLTSNEKIYLYEYKYLQAVEGAAVAHPAINVLVLIDKTSGIVEDVQKFEYRYTPPSTEYQDIPN